MNEPRSKQVGTLVISAAIVAVAGILGFRDAFASLSPWVLGVAAGLLLVAYIVALIVVFLGTYVFGRRSGLRRSSACTKGLAAVARYAFLGRVDPTSIGRDSEPPGRV